MTPQRRAVERLSIKFGIVLAVLAAAYFLSPLAWKYLSPFIIALPFAAMIQPVTRFLERKLHLKHSLAVLIMVLLLLCLLLTAVIWVLSYGVQRAGEILENPDQLIAGIMETVQKAVEEVLGPLDARLQDPGSLNSSVSNAMEEITTWGTDVAKQFLGILWNAAWGVPTILIYVNFLFMGLFFIAKDYDQLLSFLPHRRKNLTDSGAAKLTNSAIRGTIGYLKVQLIYAALSVIAGTVFWAAFGNPYAFLIGLAAGILEFIPLVGNGALYLPWTLVEMILGNFAEGILPLAIWVALYIIRRITEPRIMAHNIGLSPLLSLISMYIGYRAGGLLGMILGPVLMTVVVAIFRGGYLTSMKDDIVLLYHTMQRRWRNENLILPPEETVRPEEPKEEAHEKDGPPADPPAE
ncbi:MAG: sporulation integral membrane protein YtvI [Clostridia bacterium]|nr:sporulation integral membrane protein YtvI [Clostridia bacterium]